MTPEQIQELTNSLSDMQRAVNQLAGSSGLMADSFNRTLQSLGQTDQGLRRSTDTLTNSVNATRQAANVIQQEQANAAQLVRQNTRDTVAAMNALKGATSNMISALGSTTISLSNLSSVGNATARAVQVMGVKFGMADSAAGKLADSLGAMIKAGLDQAAAYLGVKNELTKLGAAGQHTTSSIYAYAQAAGLHSDTLNYMMTPMRALGSNLLALGRGAGDAQKAFMEMLQIGDEERQRFARLGIMQEELMSRQADYVALQGSTASNIRLQNMDMNSLRKASLEYVRNLYDLAALTGQQVDKVKEQQQQALYERRIMMETLAKQAEISNLLERAKELEAAGTPEGREEAAALRGDAAQLQRELDQQRDLIAALADLPESMRQGIIQAMLTGGIPQEEAAVLARQGTLDDILRVVSDMKASNEPDAAQKAGREIREIIANAGLQNAPGLRDAMVLGDEQLAKAFGYDMPSMEFYSKYAKRDLVGEGRGAVADRRAAEERGIDAASDLQAALQETSISLNQLADSIISGPSPLINNFNLLGDSAKAASIKLDQLAGKERPAGQEFVDEVVGGLNTGEKVIDWGRALADDPKGALSALGSNIWNKLTGKEEVSMAPPPPQTGGESTLGRESRQTPQPAPAAAAPTTAAPTTAAPTTAAPTTAAPQQAKPQPAPAEPAYVPSDDLKKWIRSQVRLRKRRDDIRKDLISNGYTPQQADAALNAELGTTATAPVTAPPVTATEAAPEARPQQTGPIDYDPSTPNVIDTVSPDQRNWLNRENELRNRLSDMVRNKKTLTKDQANQILDYYDKLKNKPGTIPTVDQIIQNSGVMRKPATAAQRQPAAATSVKPETAAPTTARMRTPRRVDAPANVAEQAGYKPLEEGNIPTNLASLIEYGIPPQYVRGNKVQEPVTGDQDPSTYDTHGEGAQIDPKLLDATQKLIALSENDGLPIPVTFITALNDYFHNKDPESRNSQHLKGRAVDFSLAKKPTTEEFSKLDSILKSIGFDYIQNEYANQSPKSTGPHIHAELNDPKPVGENSTAKNYEQPREIFQAAMGGMVSGSKSGFPAILHGNEIVVPLDPNSILADLGKKSQEQVKSEMASFEKTMTGADPEHSMTRDIARQNQQLMEMLSYKLDNVINKLETSNDTQDKILKYSQA